MINFSRFRLDNGLRVIVHEDRSTPLVAMNILYDVGSKDEDPSINRYGSSVRTPYVLRNKKYSGI